MRIFISSTVYYLIDIRAELAAQLVTLGITPVLSDDKLSDFHVKSDANSIETCLVNVASCDAVIMVLDRRYGPRLGKFGYSDVSATHLEYRHAVKLGLPVRVFVRDRLDADFRIWKRNNRSNSISLSWVSSKDPGLFELLEEHATLRADSDMSNWFSPFTDSTDLKAATAKYLEPRILPSRLVEAIHNNTFPLFDIALEAEYEMMGTVPTLKFNANLTNVGGAPAFNFRVHWEVEQDESKGKAIVPPGQSILMTLLYNAAVSHPDAEAYLIAEYESPIGISVHDRYRIHGHVHKSTLFSSGTLVDRSFKRAPALSLEIEDA